MAVLYAHAHAATVWLRAVAPCAQVTNAVTFALGAATDLPGLYSFCIYASVGAPSLCTLPLHSPCRSLAAGGYDHRLALPAYSFRCVHGALHPLAITPLATSRVRVRYAP